MVSSHRRKVRRYLLGATQKATRIWWIGQVTVRVMDVCKVTSTRPVREKAYHEAEKSRLTKRRKRGLRMNRSDRGNADRNIIRQPIPKPISSRKVNHSGRKFIWAEIASNSLRRDMERYNKFPRGRLTNPFVERARLSAKMHCVAKWTRLHTQALRCGFPPLKSLIFHDSFYEHLMYGSSRGSTVHTWEYILAGLPQKVKSSAPSKVSIEVPGRFNRGKRVTINREDFVPKKQVCRACGYFGPGPHSWGKCRSGTEPKSNGGGRQNREDGHWTKSRSFKDLF